MINVLPVLEKKVLRKEYWMRFSTIILNLILVVGFVATLLLLPSYFLSKDKEQIVERQLEAFNKENPDLAINNVDKTIKDINSKLEMLNSNMTSFQVNEKVLNNILKSRTPGITFSQILFNKREGGFILEVHGIAENRDALRNFKTELDSNPNFSSVDLPISNFLEKADLVFTISISLK